MKLHRRILQRPLLVLSALALAAAPIGATILNSHVYAAGAQLTARGIQLSDSGPSGGTITSGVGSGTNVKYLVRFTTSVSMQSLVISFCSNSPLIGDTTCSAPAGMNIAAVTVTAGSPAVTWTPTVTGSTVKITSSAPVGAQAVSLTLNNITNQTSTGSFFGRITTYTNNDFGLTSVPAVAWSGAGTEGTYAEYGGVATSTTVPIVITARVMESMLLCTSSAVYTGVACAGSAPPSLTLGHGSPTLYIDTSAVDTIHAYSQISTNATGGYAIYMRNSNACGSLSKDGGTTCDIPAVNGGAATQLAITAGTAAFGAIVGNGVATTGGTGTNSAVARWNGATGYMMDTATANDNVAYVYGSKVIDGASQQANGVDNDITFAATTSPTTPAGIYTATFSLVGVGTF